MTIIARESWKAEPLPAMNSLSTHPASHVFIHHLAGGVAGSDIDLDHDGLPDQLETILKGVESYHKNTKGWLAEAYNFFAAHTGQKVEGRGWNKQGGATGSWADRQGISIAAVGDYHTVHEVTPKLLTAIAGIIAEGINRGELAPLVSLKIIGHKDKPYATACPGQRLHAKIPKIRQLVATILNEGAPTVQTETEPPPFFHKPEGAVLEQKEGYLLLVEFLQYAVNKIVKPNPPLTVDGYFGPATKEGTGWLQAKVGVTVDYRWGDESHEALRRFVTPEPAPEPTPEPNTNAEVAKAIAKLGKQMLVLSEYVEGLD